MVSIVLGSWLPYLVTGSCLVALVAVLVQAATMQEQLNSHQASLAAAQKLAEKQRDIFEFS